MATKHFFKLLFFFTLLISLGLLGVVIVSNMENVPTEKLENPTATPTP